ncbi:MAG: DUF2933 domain-containing protein [Methanomicrobiales archaeon]|jgi:hypothetical protein
MGCCGGDMSGIKGWFQRTGIYGYLLVGLLIIVAAYFIIVHQAHLAAYSTIIFIVIFIGLHLVMMGGHGSHGGQSGEQSGGGCGGSHGGEQHNHGDGTKEGEDKQKSTGKTEDENKKGGSCH